MSVTSTVFSGTSRFSADFQQIIDRSVSIASLGLMQLENGRAALNDRSAALSSLDTRFSALEDAIAALATALDTGSYSLSNSDGTVVAASLAAGALAGTYTVEVVNAGTYTSAMSADDLPKVDDAGLESISTAASFTLTVDGVEYTIEPAANTLAALAEAINAETDAEVEATIVNIGPPEAADYRLSLKSAKLGAVALQLNDGTRDLMTTLATGTNAMYKVNGQPLAGITSSSRSVAIAPGLSLTMLKTGTATLTVARGTEGISNALSSFVAAYNAAVDELDTHRGENAGALEGDSVLFTLSEALRAITHYNSGSGAIDSLTALGLRFDDQGKLSLDGNAFASAAAEGFPALEEFFGEAATGGFLKLATDALDGLRDEADGVLTAALDSLDGQIKNQDERIAEEQDRIDRLEESLIERMAAADALIASLERQVQYFTGLFESLRIARERSG